MKNHPRCGRSSAFAAGPLFALWLSAALPGALHGQGCEPIRFLTPNLGGQTSEIIRQHQWQLAIAGRRVAANQFFVGSSQDLTKAPGGQPIDLNITSLNLSLFYGLTSRFSMALTVPFISGRAELAYPDQLRHSNSQIGIGDINLVGSLWLMNPVNTSGNIEVGLGVKAPTGSNHVLGNYYAKDGSAVRFPNTQAIQLGDGGWGILLNAQGFHQITGGLSGYVAGSYLLNPRKKTNVEAFPNVDGLPQGILWSVPDVYSARFGAAYALSQARRLSLSLGARLDGIPMKDLIGGADDGVRRVGHTWYLDPGLSTGLGRGVFTISVPVRLAARSKADVAAAAAAPNPAPGHPIGGDFANYLVFVGYTLPL